jgi:hypothetical protein
MPRQRMKTKHQARFALAELFLFPHVDPAPEGQEDGGGQESAKGKADPIEDEDLGPAGRDALRKERERVRALERQLAELKGMGPEIAAQVEEARRRQQEAVELARRAEEDVTRKVEDTRTRLEQKHQKERDALQKERDEARLAAEQLQIKTAFNQAFQAAEGRPGGHGKLTHGEAVFNQLSANLRLNNGKVVVVDDDGDPVLAADKSGPIALHDWLELQADSSDVIGAHFLPKGGVGSGGFVGTRGFRASQGRDPKEVAKMTPTQLLNQAYPD